MFRADPTRPGQSVASSQSNRGCGADATGTVWEERLVQRNCIRLGNVSVTAGEMTPEQRLKP